MATTTNEPVPFPSTPQGSTSAAQNAGQHAPPQTDAVGAEIPVVVHASRHSAADPGAGKALPPLHEETHTAIVFPQGCVVRLSASLFVGELVVLTNHQSGADVLCRVTSVKGHPGIQNYVDLHFTQSAPGFWGQRSSAELPAPSAGPAPAPAVPIAAKAPAILAPLRQPVPPPAVKASPVSPIPAAAPVPDLVPPAVPAAIPAAAVAAAVQPSRPLPIPVAAPPSSKDVLETSAGPQLLQSVQPGNATAAGGPQVWVKKSSPILGKALWGAGAALFVVGLSAGSFMLGRHGQSSSPQSTSQGTAVALPSTSAATQPIVTERANQPPIRLSSEPTAATAATAALSETSLELPSAPDRAEERSGNAPPPSRHPIIRAGKLARPVAKASAKATSSEPPPVLQTQGNGAAENILGASLIAGAARADVPAPSPSVAAQLEGPKLISSREPIYPREARQMNIGGVVVVDASVDATGKVIAAKAVSGPVLLQQAAMDMARDCKYQPARLDGQPVASHTNIAVTFAIH